MPAILVVIAGVAVVVGIVTWGIVKERPQTGAPTAKTPSSETKQDRKPSPESPVPSDKMAVVPADAAFLFDISEKNVTTGEAFALRTMVDPKGKKVSAAELHVTFDPKKLSLDAVKPSGEFSLELMGANIDNKAGTASIIVGVPLGKPAVTAKTDVAEFQFRALSATGRTEVGFSEKSMGAAEGISTNVVGFRVPTVVNIR